jgi:hypothetical protein
MVTAVSSACSWLSYRWGIRTKARNGVDCNFANLFRNIANCLKTFVSETLCNELPSPYLDRRNESEGSSTVRSASHRLVSK